MVTGDQETNLREIPRTQKQGVDVALQGKWEVATVVQQGVLKAAAALIQGRQVLEMVAARSGAKQALRVAK